MEGVDEVTFPFLVPRSVETTGNFKGGNFPSQVSFSPGILQKKKYCVLNFFDLDYKSRDKLHPICMGGMNETCFKIRLNGLK